MRIKKSGNIDAQQGAVGAHTAPEFQQVEAIPCPEAEGVALKALLEHLVGAGIHQIAGLPADIVLEEEIHVVDGLVVPRPHAGQRVAGHLRVADSKLAVAGSLVAVEHVVRAGVQAYEFGGVV